jgi:hypothetical protein
VTGLIAQHPDLPGVTWDYVQYPVGLARLGHDVYYVEDSGEWPYRYDGSRGEAALAENCQANLQHLSSVMARYGLAERWAYRFPKTKEWFGLGERQRSAVISSADLVLNVSGTIARPQKYRAAKRMAYIDSDPVFTQAKLALGQRKINARVLAHDVHFSFGEKHSRSVPETPYRWLPTRQPIVLSEWRPRSGRRVTFTTVMNLASYQPVQYKGQIFGQKDIQLRRYLDLPRRIKPTCLEIAIGRDQHREWQSAADQQPSSSTAGADNLVQQLDGAGFRLVDARAVCPDLDTYRIYIENSFGEWSVAKHGYVVGQPGWFSCRSACYLAAGKPVVVENTGFDAILPTGEALLTFGTVEEATGAIEAVRTNYARHAAAARDLATSYFDSDKVLAELIETAMLQS